MKMDEYKWIYYGEESERKFYEGGAHFRYLNLYKALEKLSKEQKQKKIREKSNQKDKLNNILLCVNNVNNLFNLLYIILG